MITVIDQPRENLYEGMSVSDACDDMLIGVYETCNDFMMNCLLTEHSYLYENGVEINYFNEDGSENENSRSLKDKFFQAVDTIRTKISALFSKIIDFISNNIDSLKHKLATIGMNKQKLDKAVEYAERNNISISFKTNGWQSKAIKNKIDSGLKEKLISNSQKEHTIYEKDEFFKEFEDIAKNSIREENGKGKEVTKSGVLSAAIDVVTGNDLIKKIRKDREEADKSLNNMKKNFSAFNGEELGEAMNRANNALKSNANVCKDMCKAYNKFYLANASIVSALIKSVKSDEGEKNKAQKEANKEAKKENFSQTPAGKVYHGIRNSGIGARRTIGKALRGTADKFEGK